MRLLLDVHHSRVAAVQLRARGHDVHAAPDDPDLAELDDEELLAAAARGGRTLVTENARDVDRIARAWAGRAGPPDGTDAHQHDPTAATLDP